MCANLIILLLVTQGRGRRCVIGRGTCVCRGRNLQSYMASQLVLQGTLSLFIIGQHIEPSTHIRDCTLYKCNMEPSTHILYSI